MLPFTSITNFGLKWVRSLLGTRIFSLIPGRNSQLACSPRVASPLLGTDGLLSPEVDFENHHCQHCAWCKDYQGLGEELSCSWDNARSLNRANSSHWTTKENRQHIKVFCIFSVHGENCLELHENGSGCFCPTNRDPFHILGRADLVWDLICFAALDSCQTHGPLIFGSPERLLGVPQFGPLLVCWCMVQGHQGLREEQLWWCSDWPRSKLLTRVATCSEMPPWYDQHLPLHCLGGDAHWKSRNLEILEPGNLKFRIPRNPKNMKILKMKIPLPKMLARSGLVGGIKHPNSISRHFRIFFQGPETRQNICVCFLFLFFLVVQLAALPIFLGGPRGSPCCHLPLVGCTVRCLCGTMGICLFIVSLMSVFIVIW